MSKDDDAQLKRKFRMFYVKAFLLYTLLFGGIMSLWELYDTGHVNIIKQVFQSIFFGSLMAWTNVTAKRRALSQSEKEKYQHKDR